jgi:uncharacterized membrane protein YfcA
MIGPDPTYWLALGGVAFLTSVVSGVMGMAGGMLLLTFMLLRLEPALVIPLHGAVQLIANASRAWFLRRHVVWPAVWRFAWPLVPCGALGLWLLGHVPVGASRVGIGVFVLASTWLKSFFSISKDEAARRALPLGGALVGFFSTLVGATGPLLAPFVLALELGSQPTIATLAACQIFQHGSKVALFGLRGFAPQNQWLPCLGLGVAAIAGSAVGTRLLDRVPQDTFRLTVRVVLSALALQQIWQGLSR